MRPKTKIQKRIDILSKTLKKLNRQDNKWIKNKLNSYVYTKNYEYICLDCNYVWKNTDYPQRKKKLICPKCKQTLRSLPGRTRTTFDYGYFGFISTVENLQLIRIFYGEKRSMNYDKPKYYINEVIQHWIGTNNIHIVRAVLCNMFSYYAHLSYGNNMEIRNNNNRYYSDMFVYPKMKLLSVLKRNGFKGGLHGFYPVSLFEYLMNNNKAEVLFKLKQYRFLAEYMHYDEPFNTYWPTIKICIKNNYVPSDISIYFDYLDLLSYFNKDLHNKVYVCPDDLKHEHDKYVKKKRIRLKKEKAETLRILYFKQKQWYEEHKSKFFSLNFVQGDITVSPIKSLEQVINESEQLDHCAYVNGYHMKDNNILFSVKKGQDPIATVDFSLIRMDINQISGFKNAEIPEQKKVTTLIKKNIKLIRECITKDN